MSKIIDLTNQMAAGSPSYPGHPQISFTEVRRISKEGSSVQLVAFSNHAGTHLDAPSHFIESGRTVEEIPLELLIGPAALLDLTDKESGSVIELQDLETRPLNWDSVKRLLIYTGWDRYYGTTGFFEDFPSLSLAAARFLVDKKIQLVGIDSPSIGPKGNPGAEVHRLLLEKEVVIIESLCNLSSLLNKNFKISALPLPLQGCSGAPCRVIAIINGEK